MHVHFWGGTHRNELDPELTVADLDSAPVVGVTQGIVDTVARPGEREPNMNRFYSEWPTDHPKAVRAAEVVALNNSPEVDIVIDAHNTKPGSVDFAWIDLDNVDPKKFNTMLRFLKMIDIKRIVNIAGYNTMLSYCPSAFMVEIVPEGKLSQPSYWRGALTRLVAGDLPDASTSDFNWYDYAIDVPMAWQEEKNLPEHIGSFEELPDTIIAALGLPVEKMVAINWQPSGMWLAETAFVTNPPPDILPQRSAPKPYPLGHM